MQKRVYISGIGVISAIGTNVQENFESLFAGKSGIGELRHIKTRLNQMPVGEVQYSNEALAKLAEVNPEQGPYTRTDLLGIVAAKEALRSSGITDVNAFKTGLVSANSVGGMGHTELHWSEYLNEGSTQTSDKWVESHDAGYSTTKIAECLGITDYLSTISTACSSSTNAILLGARLIKNGVLDRVVVGGTDALSKFTMNGFNTLMILDDELCKPFDVNRKGLNLGEGAGYLVLESEEAIQGKLKYGEILGYANSNDAFHQTASSPTGEGAYLAMSKALKVANLQPDDIDYINAHGTGTQVNDLSEGTAIQRVFKGNYPAISSTKAFTGHTLGACGGIEAVYCVLAIQKQVKFANLHFKEGMEELEFRPILKNITTEKVERVLSNSFGFGGNTSSVIIGSV